MRKVISLLLTTIMLLSMFSIGFTANAEEVTSEPSESVMNSSIEKAAEPITEKAESPKEKTVTKKKDKVSTGAATSGKCGANATWSYNTSTNTLTISGSGAMWNGDEQEDFDWNEDSSAALGYNLTATKIVINSGITSIGDYAFYDFNVLTSISIPNTVTRIGEESITSSSLTSLTLPDSVTTIAVEGISGDNLYNISCSMSVANLIEKSKSSFLSKLPFGVVGDNVQWSYNTSTKTLTLKGTGATYDFTNKFDKNNSIYKYADASGHSNDYGVKVAVKVVVDEGVTKIGDYCLCGGGVFFGGQSTAKLTTVELPSTLTSIGAHAFENNVNLANVTMPSGVQIGTDAFAGCLYSPPNTLPGGSCGANTRWEYDSSIETLTISGTGNTSSYGSNTSSAPWANYNKNVKHIIVSSGVTGLGNYNFYFPYLEDVVIPNTLTYISPTAFRASYNLRSFKMSGNQPENTYVDFGAFSWETFAEIPQSLEVNFAVKGLLTYSYGPNSGNISWSIKDGTLRINGTGSMAGAYGWSLSESSTSNTEYGTFSIGENSNSPWYRLCRNQVKKVIVEEGITSITGFELLSNLEEITIPSTVTTIGERSHSFYKCESLTSLCLPNSVTNIDFYSFLGCSNLNIALTDNVEAIGTSAFYGCKSVICPVNSYSYNLLTSDDFAKYRRSFTEVVGTISENNQLNSLFSVKKSASISKKSKLTTSASSNLTAATQSSSLYPAQEDLSAEQIKDNLSYINCYVIENVVVDDTIRFGQNNNIKLHLNSLELTPNGNISIDSNGNIVNGDAHTITSSIDKALVEVPCNLNIITTGEGQGGIVNDSGKVFDVQEGGSLTIENGVYSEDVSDYIADNKVMGKTGNRYTVLNNNTKDLTPENDNHTFILDGVEKFAREDLLGVQIRQKTDTVSQAMRFVSAVRTDVLRGAKDYGFVLAKGKNIDNMRVNKDELLADSDKCIKVSAVGSANSLADTAYSSSNLNEGSYKYITAAVTSIEDDSAAIGARFYIERQDGTYVYADYICCSTMGELKTA